MQFEWSPRHDCVGFLVVCWCNNIIDVCTGGGTTQPASSSRAHRLCTMHPVAVLTQVPLLSAAQLDFRVVRSMWCKIVSLNLSSCENYGLRHRWFWLRFLHEPTMCSIHLFPSMLGGVTPSSVIRGILGEAGWKLCQNYGAASQRDVSYSSGKSGGYWRGARLRLLPEQSSRRRVGGVNSAHCTEILVYINLESTSYWQLNWDGLKL